MSKWSKVAKGDHVELRGRVYEVLKIKTKGASAKVTVRGAGSVFESKVALADKVTLVADPLRDKGGAQTRWAKPGEGEDLAPTLPPGDAAAVTRPAKPSADPWETKRDEVERRLDDILGAHLVGESIDEAVGYYVPPVDAATVEAHLVLFHGAQLSDWDENSDLVQSHESWHAGHLEDPEGQPLKVNHWHTKARPRA